MINITKTLKSEQNIGLKQKRFLKFSQRSSVKDVKRSFKLTKKRKKEKQKTKTKRISNLTLLIWFNL